MKSLVLMFTLCAVTYGFSTTRVPHVHHTVTHASGHHINGGLYKLIVHEVAALMKSHPDLSVDNCSTKCDALFDLVAHVDERTTDAYCHMECSRVLGGVTGMTLHHGHQTTAPTTVF